MSEVITTDYSEIRRLQEFFMKRINYTVGNSSHFLPWLSCHDLDKRSMSHD